MSDRSSFDGPARVIVIVLGFVLIAASVPFVAALLPPDHTYTLTWHKTGGEAQAAEVGDSSGPSATRELAIHGTRTATLVVSVNTCNDAPATPADANAIITWTVSRRTSAGTEAIATDKLSCSQASGYTKEIPRLAAPDKGEVVGSGKNQSAARTAAVAALWDEFGYENETATYVLTVQYERAASQIPSTPLPLPIPGSSLDATVQLKEFHWNADLEEKTPEVGK